MQSKSKLMIGIFAIMISILVLYPTSIQAQIGPPSPVVPSPVVPSPVVPSPVVPSPVVPSPVVPSPVVPSLQISVGTITSRSVIAGGESIKLDSFAIVPGSSVNASSITYSWNSTAGSFSCASCNTTQWTAPVVSSDTIYTITVAASATGYNTGTSSIKIIVTTGTSVPSPPPTVPSTSIPGDYIDIIDLNGNIKRSYHNSADFSTHSDIGIDQLRAWRIMRIAQLNDTIQNLPDNNFTSPVLTSRTTLIADMNDLVNYTQYDEFHFAISKLSSIKEKMDGFEGGNPADDLIIDSTAQKKILPLIDDITHTTALAGQPSNNIAAPLTVIPNPEPDHRGTAPTDGIGGLSTTIGEIPVWGLITIAVGVIAGLLVAIYRIK